MKRDVLAITATAAAIIVMVVALVAMCAGPAQAAPPISDKEESIGAQNRGYRAIYLCSDGIQALATREWEWLMTDVFKKNRPYGVPVSVTLAVEPISRDWVKPDVSTLPPELLGKPILKPRGEVVTFKTEDGTSTCTARYVKTTDQIDDRYDDWNWVVENVSVKGVGTVSVVQNGKTEKAKKASVAKR
jgi:hypothetical protein